MKTFFVAYLVCVSCTACGSQTDRSDDWVYESRADCLRNAEGRANMRNANDDDTWAYGCDEVNVKSAARIP